jgi:ribosomal protein S27E
MGVKRDVLDKVATGGCAAPGCDHSSHPENNTIFMRSKCHPEARGVDVSYELGSGELTVSCQVCGRLVVAVDVAE